MGYVPSFADLRLTDVHGRVVPDSVSVHTAALESGHRPLVCEAAPPAGREEAENAATEGTVRR